MRKRLKNKRRSCGLCKPHKRGWEDRRGLQERRRDESDRRDYACH